MANNEQYGSGTTPQKSDTKRMLMVKELIATNAGGGGGGGGVTQIKTFDGNPNGNVLLAGPGLVLNIGATAGGVWEKTTAGTTNNEWVQLIAP